MKENKKFYRMSIAERRELLREETALTEAEMRALCGQDGLTEETADHMSENVIGRYALPLGIARNFVINDKAVNIPMVTEEPSVIAAASNGARIVAKNGGFIAHADASEMIGQLQLVSVPNLEKAAAAISAAKEDLLTMLKTYHSSLTALGGGPRDIQTRPLPETEAGPMLIVHLIIDVRDAMGANAVNTALERIAPEIEKLTGAQARLRILSNYAENRLARASCSIAPETLSSGEFEGEETLNRILEAAAFAEADPYRAVTHNKGIMNGIDAVLLAIGNDWRAAEAGAYAWSARSGALKPLSHWRKDSYGNLHGSIELPLALGTVGGATRAHPGANAALKLIRASGAQELAGFVAAVGLAQNLAALRALSTEGIQKGHMALHARQMAMAAGAEGSLVEEVAARLVASRTIRVDFAKEILDEILGNRE